jgi:hypothetical protein
MTPHGFVARYQIGDPVYERNGFPDEQGRVRATNWSEVNLEKVEILELWWQGDVRVVLDKGDLEGLTEWIFFHTGISDGKQASIQSRTIGFWAGGERYLATVDEKTGRLTDTSALLY